MPSRLKKAAIWAASVAVVVAAAVLYAVAVHYGGVRELLQLPAVLDASTPATQQGFTLIDITRGHPNGSDFTLANGAKMYLATRQTSGDTILWIRPPELPTDANFRSANHGAILHQFFQARATSSLGDIIDTPWYFDGGCLRNNDPCTISGAGRVAPDLIAAVIPAGYPGDTTYFDTSISDEFGHKAKWRIEHLPRMRPTALPQAKPTYHLDGAAVALVATRTWSPTTIQGAGWPQVNFNLTLLPLEPTARHEWEFAPSPNYSPSLSWEPYRLPWLTGPDSSAEVNVDDSWLLSREKVKTGVTSIIHSPYVRGNTQAIYHGILSQFATRQDSVDIRDVTIDTVEATEAGLREDTYCLYEPHKITVKSTSGLTIVLPKQKKSAARFIYMVPNSLNLLWRLSPLSPGISNQSAGMLPDSPLCRLYHRPVTVWFEAFADGQSLGITYGVPWQPSNGEPVSVHFPAPMALPRQVHDLRITIHQRVDLLRMPVTLSANIINE